MFLRHRGILLVTLFILHCAGALAQDEPDASEAMTNVMVEVIRPGYLDLRHKAESLDGAIAALCTTGSSSALRDARIRFTELVEAWGRIEMVRFGPILGDNLLERVFFFPDRRGSGLKRVQKLLANKNPEMLEQDRLAISSVAAQGLFAAEYVLFGKGSELLESGQPSFRCSYGQAVAANILSSAELLDREWNGTHPFLTMWTEPGLDNPVFADQDAALTHLLSTVVHGLEEVRDVRLSAFMKATAEKDRPKAAPLWRSSNTMRLLAANVESVEAIYFASYLRQYLPADQSLISESVESLFGELKKSIDTETPVAEALSDQDRRQNLEHLRSILSELIRTLNQQFAAALGLRVGFFFADGD